MRNERPAAVPGHETHDKIANLAVLGIAPASYVVLLALGEEPASAYTGSLIVVGAHLFGSWLLSPDLDLDSAIDDRWGPLRFLWIPYMRLIPHRSPLSHSGISGILRLTYLYVMLVLLLLLLQYGARLLGVEAPPYHTMFTEWVWGSVQNESHIAALIIVGVVISDLVHVLADQTSSRSKRRSRSRRR